MGTRQEWRKIQRRKNRCKKKNRFVEIALFLAILIVIIGMVLILH